MFYCLTLGIAVIDSGTENDTLARWDRDTEITHFDLTPSNVFMGYRDNDHNRYPVLKIADFETAKEEPRMETQTDETGIGYPIARAGFFRPPEANPHINVPLKNPRKGTTTNIFQIGCVMHCLIKLASQDFRILKRGSTIKVERFGRQLPTPGEFQQRGETHGVDLNDIDEKVYSKELCSLVMKCMFREPLFRPTALELQREVKLGLDTATAIMEGRGLPRDDTAREDIPMAQVIWPQPPNLVREEVQKKFDILTKAIFRKF